MSTPGTHIRPVLASTSTVAALALLLLGACGDEGDDDGPPYAQDFVEFCRVYERVVCYRLRESSPACLDVPAGERCYDAPRCTQAAIERDCLALDTWSAWAGDRCSPTPTTEEASECIRALSDTATGYPLDVPEDTIPECLLCG